MRTLWAGRILDVVYDSLPHWIVDYGCYSVTLRCVGSLPEKVRERLEEITGSLRTVEPASEQAAALRRKQFAVLEKFLDASTGFAPFISHESASAMQSILAKYECEGLAFAGWTVMPNHLHLLTRPFCCESTHGFFNAWRRFKQTTAVEMNRVNGRKGSFWQQHWYDRWVRSPVEYSRWVRYFAENPVKAGLCAAAEEYPFTKIPEAAP